MIGYFIPGAEEDRAPSAMTSILQVHNGRWLTLTQTPMPFHPHESSPPSSVYGKKPSGNITHVSFLQFVVVPIILIDADESESIHYTIEVEAHVDESVNEIGIVTVVTITKLAR